MPRKKVKLAWIENDDSRAISLKKRMVGLLKKVRELTILCDLSACILIFSPHEAEPVVWPSAERTHDLLDDYFALPEFEQRKKLTSVESYLEEKTKKIREQLVNCDKQKKEYAIDEMMSQIQKGRKIDDFNVSEIYALLSFSRDTVTHCRKRLDTKQFPPLRDPPVLPSEVQVEELKTTTDDVFVGDAQDDDRAGERDEASRRIYIDEENRSHYLIDQWLLASNPLKPDMYQQIEDENPNPRSYYPYQGSSSKGNSHLEMDPVWPQSMSFHDLVGSVSQPLQHHNLNSNPIMAMNQPTQYPFDFMSREQEVNEEGSSTNNLQFHRSNRTITTNNGLHQEPPPNGTTSGEGNADATSFDINRVWPDFNNHHF